MNVYGSGLIIQLSYASSSGAAAVDNFALITEDGTPILSEDGQNVDVEN